MSPQLSSIVAALRGAERVAVLTGAGVSAESGIPTFRDELTGLWESFDAADLATPYAFERDPALVWGWYEWRRMQVLRAQPNPGHQAIARIAERVQQFTLITQNVDDLHERGGSRHVLHLHGELSRPYCEACRNPYAHLAGIPQLPEGGTRLEPPRCQACGARVRPGVVWFGESLPELEWLAAVEAVKACDVFLSVGTSSVVQPAASLLTVAKRAGAVTVIVNPNPTEADDAVPFVLRGPAGRVLPHVVSKVWGSGTTGPRRHGRR